MPEITDRAERIRRNRDVADRAGYQYIFSPSSVIFHRKECCCGLSAVTVQGCASYRTAVKNRRPCKLCRPEPETEGQGGQEQRQDGEGEKLSAGTQSDINEVVWVRLLGGRAEFVKRKNILGSCHNLIHPGKLTKKLMEAHGCIRKQCPFFKKNEEVPYWAEMERRRIQKAAIRKKRKENARRAAAEAAKKLERLKTGFQACFDRLGYAVRVIRVETVKPNVFRIFYVSDRKYPDGLLYRDFYEAVQNQNPPCRVLLRHIRDVDGHYVTREEYNRRFG